MTEDAEAHRVQRQRELLDLATRLHPLSAAERTRFLSQIDPQLRVDLEKLLTPPPAGYLESDKSREVLAANGIELRDTDDLAESAPDDTETKNGPRSLPPYPDPGRTESPERVGRYRILRPIGHGGQGAVFEAVDDRGLHRRHVALKVCSGLLLVRSHFERLEAEYHALSLLDHPNVAQVYDAGRAPAGHPYFAMELITGGSITDFVRARETPQGERLHLFRGACEGVAHAHQRGIIHRDLKPSNVLVSTDAKEPIAKIIDFGIAKSLEQTLVPMEPTHSGAVLGTRSYSSPEQVRGEVKRIDTRSDVYSLGVLLYELLTNQHPLRADGERLDLATLESRWTTPPRRPSTLTPKGAFSRELDWIVLRCLESNPADRYQSVRDLIRDLDRLARGEAISAAPPSALYRATKWSRRHWRAISFLTLVTALAMVPIWMKLAEEDQLRRRNKALLATLLSPGPALQSFKTEFDPWSFRSLFDVREGFGCLRPTTTDGLRIEQDEHQDYWSFYLDQKKGFLGESFDVEVRFDASGVSLPVGAFHLSFSLVSRSGGLVEVAWYFDPQPDGNNQYPISYKVPRGDTKGDESSDFVRYDHKVGRVRLSRHAGTAVASIWRDGQWFEVHQTEGCNEPAWVKIGGARYRSDAPQSLTLESLEVTVPEISTLKTELVDDFDEDSPNSGYAQTIDAGVPLRLGGTLLVESAKSSGGVTMYIIPARVFALQGDFEMSIEVSIEQLAGLSSGTGSSNHGFDSRIGLKLTAIDDLLCHCEFVLMRRSQKSFVRALRWPSTSSQELEITQNSVVLGLRRRGSTIEWRADGKLMLEETVTDDPLVIRLLAQTKQGVSAELKFDRLRARNLRGADLGLEQAR